MNKQKVLLLGASGQLGTAFARLLEEKKVELKTYDRNSLDLTDLHQLDKALNEFAPTIIINASAYTNVEKAESDTLHNELLNTEVPKVLARWAADHNSLFVHYSTDFVFNSPDQGGLIESDPTDPVNEYGRAKLEGERAVIEAGGKHLIFRTSWVYSESDKNFVGKILLNAAKLETLKVVDDEFGNPTYATDLARDSWLAVEKCFDKEDFNWGIFHLSGKGFVNRHDFSKKIVELAREFGADLLCKEILPIKSSDLDLKAQRPEFSILDCSKFEHSFGMKLRPWEESLSECLKNKYS